MKLKSNQILVGSHYTIGLIEDEKVVVGAGEVGEEELLRFLPFHKIIQGDDIGDYLLGVYDNEQEQELLEEFLTKLEEYENEVH